MALDVLASVRVYFRAVTNIQSPLSIGRSIWPYEPGSEYGTAIDYYTKTTYGTDTDYGLQWNAKGNGAASDGAFADE